MTFHTVRSTDIVMVKLPCRVSHGGYAFLLTADEVSSPAGWMKKPQLSAMGCCCASVFISSRINIEREISASSN